MPRFFFIALFAIILVGDLLHAQAKKGPPNIVNDLGMKFVWIPPGNISDGQSRRRKKEKE